MKFDKEASKKLGIKVFIGPAKSKKFVKKDSFEKKEPAVSELRDEKLEE